MYSFPFDYLDGDNVVDMARGLIGSQLLLTHSSQQQLFTIVETEAYRHYGDQASHARSGQPTKRTSVMFGPSGHAYIYLCYGIHWLFNIVTNVEGKADAILIRGLREEDGGSSHRIIGPGRVGKALRASREFNNHDLRNGPLQLVGEVETQLQEIQSNPRVGIDYAGKDALLPWRFSLPDQIG